mgnify:CR=1 FL=1
MSERSFWQDDAELIERAAQHGWPGKQVLADGFTQKTFRREDTDIALADASDFSTGTTRLPGGVVSFAANETEQIINIDVSQDKKFEPDEIFRVILSEASSNDSTGTEISATAHNSRRHQPLIVRDR